MFTLSASDLRPWGAAILLLVAAGALDLATTLYGLEHGFTEGGAWAAAWHEHAGTAGLIGQKAAATVLVVAVAVLLPVYGGLLVYGAAAVTAGAAARNLVLIGEAAGWVAW